MSDLEGQNFAGYEILAKLGQGGMGSVYKARQPMLSRLVALKMMTPQLGADPSFVARFIREAAAAANLNHPNMVQVYTAGEQDGVHFIAMEFVDGESLKKRMNRLGRIEPREAVAITVYVAQALQYAWNKAHLIHRDIKPDNIFLSNSGEVKVGDLGLAKSVGSETTELTQTGTAMGSPHYISPEQAQGTKDIDFRTDIYSLGCTLYHMLTGQTPYSGDSSIVIMMKHVNDPPPAIFKAWPTCPMYLGRLVGRMLAKQRHERPASYEELVAELMTVHDKLAHTEMVPPVSASPAPAARPALQAAVRVSARSSGGNKTWAYAAAGTAAAIALAGLLLWSPWKSSEEVLSHESRVASATEPTLQSAPSTIAPDAGWQDAINLLPLIDPKEDAIAGEWTMENGALVGSRNVYARLELPYRPPEEYDFRIVFTPSGNAANGCQQLKAAGKELDWNYGVGPQWRVFGFEEVEGKGAMASRHSGYSEPVQIGRKNVSLVEVRHDRIRGYFGGKLLSELSLDKIGPAPWPGWRLRDGSRLGVGTQTLCTYHAIEVREVTGKGTFMRGMPPKPGSLVLQETRVTALTTAPKAGEVCPLDMGGGVTMDLMGIPPGEFMQGSTKEEQEWARLNVAAGHAGFLGHEGETPRKAAIKQGFWMARTEVTVGQWKQFANATGYVTQAEKKQAVAAEDAAQAMGPKGGLNWQKPKDGFPLTDHHAVLWISWNDAKAFCDWLDQRERNAGRLPAGLQIRLPTEAEWEYACRAGTQTKFWWGDSAEDSQGRLNLGGQDDGFDFVAPVDSYGARGRNGFGLADMLGNAREWCLDEFDPAGAHEEHWTGNPSERVLRGGCFVRGMGLTRSAFREKAKAWAQVCCIGFRIAVAPALGTPTASSAPAASVTKETSALPPAEWRNLIPAIVLPRDAVAGGWKVENGRLLCTTRDSWALCEIPVDYKDGDYDLRFRVTRGEGSTIGIFFLFRRNQNGGAVVFDYSFPDDPLMTRGFHAAGLVRVDGKRAPRNDPHTERAQWLPKRQEKTVLLQVRDRGLVVSLDGETLFHWEGNWEEVQQRDGPFRKRAPMFGVSAFMNEATFSAIEMRAMPGASAAPTADR